MNNVRKIDLKGMTSTQMVEWIASIGEKPFRAKQIRQWIFQHGISDFEQMTNLSKTLRDRLNSCAYVTDINEVSRQVSRDGTIKLLFKLWDGLTIESVWIPDGDRGTLCVSTQVGCKLGCKFCLTGDSGFTRNLDAGEIVDQLMQVRKSLKVTNIVFMGMGEPLDNYENVLQTLRIFTEQDTALLGARKITLSTAGVAPGIAQLANDFPKIKLAVSLNAADDQTRSKIMPINKKYPLAKLVAALKKWPLPAGRLITFEYVLLSGVNDSDEDARKLVRFAGKLPCKINLIPYNPCPHLSFKRPGKKRIARFSKILTDSGLMAFQRDSRGADILAACGQLRGVVENAV